MGTLVYGETSGIARQCPQSGLDDVTKGAFKPGRDGYAECGEVDELVLVELRVVSEHVDAKGPP
jgi:hypothetical protein